MWGPGGPVKKSFFANISLSKPGYMLLHKLYINLAIPVIFMLFSSLSDLSLKICPISPLHFEKLLNLLLAQIPYLGHMTSLLLCQWHVGSMLWRLNLTTRLVCGHSKPSATEFTMMKWTEERWVEYIIQLKMKKLHLYNIIIVLKCDTVMIM